MKRYENARMDTEHLPVLVVRDHSGGTVLAVFPPDSYNRAERTEDDVVEVSEWRDLDGVEDGNAVMVTGLLEDVCQ